MSEIFTPDTSRQTEVFLPDQYKNTVTIIGVGATGGWLALNLAKMGVKKLCLIDNDVVEAHNIANQIYSPSDVGKQKVAALYDILRKASQFDEDQQEITIKTCFVTEENVKDVVPPGFVFICVDSMKSRKEIVDAISFDVNYDSFVDTRMGTNVFRCYIIDPKRDNLLQQYKKTLYSDEEAIESFCGVSQSIVATAQMLAAYATWQFIDFVAKKINQEETIFAISEYPSLTTFHYPSVAWPVNE